MCDDKSPAVIFTRGGLAALYEPPWGLDRWIEDHITGVDLLQQYVTVLGDREFALLDTGVIVAVNRNTARVRAVRLGAPKLDYAAEGVSLGRGLSTALQGPDGAVVASAEFAVRVGCGPCCVQIPLETL